MKEFFQDIKKAVTDFDFYRTVKDFEVSRSIKYIFSLIFLITLILTVRFSFDLKRGINIAADWAIQNLPAIQIQNGEVSADVQQPYKIEEEGFALIIDTTGQTTSLDGYEKGILLMKNQLVYKESAVKTETHNLADIEALRIDENFVNGIRKNAVWMLFPIMLILAFLSAAISKFFQIFAFSLISLAASTMTKVNINYKQIFNIGVYGITASYVLGGLVALAGLRLPLFGLIYAGLYITYLIAGVQRSKEMPEAA